MQLSIIISSMGIYSVENFIKFLGASCPVHINLHILMRFKNMIKYVLYFFKINHESLLKCDLRDDNCDLFKMFFYKTREEKNWVIWLEWTQTEESSKQHFMDIQFLFVPFLALCPRRSLGKSCSLITVHNNWTYRYSIILIFVLVLTSIFTK